MTKTYYYHDTRRTDKKGRSQIKVGISKNRKTAFIPTGVWAHPENWDSEGEMLFGYQGAKTDNALLSSVMNDVTSVISDLRLSGKIKEMHATEIKETVTEVMFPQKARKKKAITFTSVFESFKESKTKPGTHRPYQITWNHMHAFDGNIDSKTFEDIDINWLTEFEAFLAKTANKNARNIHLRNIRAVFNHAIDHGMTSEYPFRTFKIRPQETEHRSLSLEQVRLLRDTPCEPHQEKYRDMFILMIYLVGINAADLFTPHHAKIHNGRIEYFRMKTQKEGTSGKFISVKIEPEAQAIIDRYFDYEKGLFTFMDGRANYKSFLRKMDKELKRIGSFEKKGQGGKKHFTPLFPGLSQYWSRHTWASLAIEADVPESTVSFALGHDTRIATTAIYIKVNQKKLDEGNRRVIDYINGNDMDIQLNEKTSEMVKELADSQGMSEDEVVQKIVEWYFLDCNKEN